MVLLWYGRHLKKYYLQELNQSEMYLLSIRKKESEIKNKALSQENIKKYTDNKEIIKIIYVKNKLVNIVVKN